MKGDRTFVDTDILVYAHDSSAGLKHKKAVRIFVDLWETKLGILSTQVLQEFFVVVTNKIPRPLHQDKVEELIIHLLKGNANVLLSENFQSGQVIESMKIVNPFQ